MSRTAEGEKLKDDLSNYDSGAYKKPSVTVDIAICSIINETLKIMLIKRKYPPFRDTWALPGGFLEVEKEESLEETARRELYEETHLKGIYMEQLKSYGDPHRDPRMRIITVAYYALVPEEKVRHIQAGDDAKEVAWFPVRDLPDLAFDHRKIISDLLTRLEGKILYTPIGFHLVPEEFTWTELQRVYEIILDTNLLAPNFRRKIQSQYKLENCNSKKKLDRPGKPPRYLRLIKEKESFSKGQ